MTSWGDQKYIKFPFIKFQNLKPINGTSSNAISIGNDAGFVNQDSDCIAIGNNAAYNTQQTSSIAIGNSAGYDQQQTSSIAIGNSAGYSLQQQNSIAIGNAAGYNQGEYSIAIGEGAGINTSNPNNADYSIAIGPYAGNVFQVSNSIILNASSTPLQGYDQGFHVKPIRNVYFNKMLVYDISNNEITYDDNPFSPAALSSCKLINDIKGISFCDNSYIGQGASFDLNLFDMSFNNIVNINAISNTGPDYNGASIITNKRIKQTINSGTTWDNTNGYYGLAQESYPSVSPAYSTLAVSTWTSRTVADRLYNAIAWSPELRLFVSLGAGTTSNIYSSDGVTWTLTTASSGNNWNSIAWSSEARIFIGVASNGGSRVIRSSNGTSWTTVANLSGGSPISTGSWQSVCWSKELNRFVAVSTEPYVMYTTAASTTSTTWTVITVGIPAGLWSSICWAKEISLFVAVGTDGTVMSSPDGITWTLRTAAVASQWQSVCWSSPLGMFVAVGLSLSLSNEGVMYSYNGIVWYSLTGITQNTWNSVCWSNELEIFLAVGLDSTSPLDSVMYSRNGINWSYITLTGIAPSNNWKSVCWSPELGIFASTSTNGISPTAPRVMTSSLKGRPPTAYNVFDSSFNSIDQNGNWTFTPTTSLTITGPLSMNGNINMGGTTNTITNVFFNQDTTITSNTYPYLRYNTSTRTISYKSLAYGNFLNTTASTAITANTNTSLTYTSSSTTLNVSTSGSTITFTNPGIYKIGVSIAAQSGTAGCQIKVWFAKPPSTPITNSTSIMYIPDNGNITEFYSEIIHEITTAGAGIIIFIRSNANCTLSTTAADGANNVPAGPSVVTTILQIA